MGTLKNIFTEDVIRKLQKRLSKPFVNNDERERLLLRLNVLTASGPYPSDSWEAARLRYLRAKKAAWETYVQAAFVCGLFEGRRGNDLRSRLFNPDSNEFQGAMAECLACWFFAGKYGMKVLPFHAQGQNNPELDFTVESLQGNFHVEVKSPYRPQPQRSGCGDDADLIKGCLEQADKQFEHGNRNFLVLVPNLRTKVFDRRGQLIKAFYGEGKVTFPIDMKMGSACGPAKVEFFSEGRFLKMWGSQGPRFTRVSAVICIEEGYEDRFGLITHRTLVAHNPHARIPCLTHFKGNIPQFTFTSEKKEAMAWTDGHPLS